MMEKVCTIVCLVGVLILLGSVGYWLLNRGEAIAQEDILRYERNFFGTPKDITPDADKIAKALGPYDLKPADNPVLMILSTDTTYDMPDRPTLYAIGFMQNAGGQTIWSDKQIVSFTVETSGGVGRDGYVVMNTAFKPIKVEQDGSYTLSCDFESEPEDWFRNNRMSFDMKITLRRNAVAFPVVLLLVGLVLAAAGGGPLAMLHAGEPSEQDEQFEAFLEE